MQIFRNFLQRLKNLRSSFKRPNPLSGQVTKLAQRIEVMKRDADKLAIEFKKCFDEVKRREPELQAIVDEADREAAKMRDYYSMASEAYANGNGAVAKSLSIQGHLHQDQTEALNEKAQAIREIGKLGKQKQAKCKALNAEVVSLTLEHETVKKLMDVGKEIHSPHATLLDNRLGKLTGKSLQALSSIGTKSLDALKALLLGLSNPHIDEQMALCIPDALSEIIQSHPNIAGLFLPISTRGPGAKAWIHNLVNPIAESATGTAYELLATRQLMHRSAGDLKIQSGDSISFGPKLQARYNPDNTKTAQLLASLIQISPKRWSIFQTNPNMIERRTVEADVLLYRGGQEIFVDFKYTKGTKKNLVAAELLGVALALSTGEIHQAHFVCNGKIDKVSRNRIDDINRVLTRWECGPIKAQQNYQW
ncbi:MAG: putative nuclear RNA export factor SDE5 [Nitrospinae bacterium]|nr:putative nuclear RNA export factor SDE5 [Nitrospinota bacterium]